MGELGARSALERGGERLHVQPVALDRDGKDLGSELAQNEQRAVIRGCLDDDRVAGLDHQLEQERVGLHRAVGGDHLLAIDAVTFGDPVAQGAVAARGPVRERALRIAREGSLGGGAEVVDRDDVERGGAAGERDR